MDSLMEMVDKMVTGDADILGQFLLTLNDQGEVQAANVMDIVTTCRTKQPDVAAVEQKCLEGMRAFAEQRENSVLGLVESGAVAYIYAAIDSHEESAAVAKAAADCFLVLAQKGMPAAAVKDGGGLMPLLRAVQAHQDARVAGLQAVVVLANDEQAPPVFVKWGVVQSTTEALRLHCSTSSDVAIEACGAIAVFCQSPKCVSDEHSAKELCVTDKVADSIMTAMKSFPDKPDLLQNVARAIVCLTKGDSEMKEAFINEHAVVPLLVHSLQQHAEHCDAQKQLMACIRTLATVPSGRTAFATGNTAAAIKAAFDAQHQSPAFALNAIQAAQVLSVEPNLCRQLATLGVVEKVVNAMQGFPEDAQIQSAGCAALTNISLHPDAKDIAGRCRAITAVVAAMKTDEENKETLINACAAIANLCVDHSIHKSMVAKENGLAVLLNVARKYKDDPVPVANSMSAMRSVCANSLPHQQQLADADAVPILIECTQLNIGDISVLRHATALFWALSYNTHIAEALAKSSAVTILGSLLSHEDPAIQLQSAGCVLVISATNGGDLTEALIAAELHTAVCQMLDATTPNIPVQKMGLGILENVLYCPAAGITEDDHKAFTSAAINAMKEHVISGDVVEVACKTLQNLALCGPVIRKHMLECNIMPSVTKALANHDRDAAIQEVCLSCLSTLIDDEGQRDEVLDANPELIMLTRKTMDRFRQTGTVQTSGCILMRTFVDNSESGQQAFIGTNGVETVLKAIESHFSNNQVLTAAFSCLSDVAAGSQGNAELISRAGGPRHAMRALMTYGSEPGLLSSVFVLLSLLPINLDLSAPFDFQVGVNCTLKALLDFEDDACLQERAVSTLWNFSMQSEDSRHIIHASGGLQDMVKFLSNSTSDKLQENVCCALWSLSEGKGGSATELLKLGIIETLTTTIKEKQDKPDVVKHACAALANMVTVDGAEEFLAAANTVTVIKDTIMQHSGNAGVQQYALSVCCDLALLDKTEILTDLLDKDMIMTIVGEMKAQPALGEVQQFGAAALAEFASLARIEAFAEVHDRIMEADVFTVITSGIECHKDDAGPIGSLWHLLMELGKHATKHEATIASPELLPRLSECMQQHVESQHVQLYCFGYLWAVTRMVPALAAVAVEQQIIQHAVTAVPKHIQHDEICASILTMFSAIAAAADDVRAQIVKLNVIPAILKIMRAHDSNVEIQYLGCVTLSDCCSDFEEYNQNALVFSEALPAVLQAAKSHTDCVDLQMHALNVFKNIAYLNGDNQGILLQLQVVELTHDIMETHADAELQRLACTFVTAASTGSEDMQFAFGQKGCIGTIMQAIDKFGDDDRVVNAAFRAIGCLAESLNNHELIGDSILGLVKEKMESFFQSTALLTSACVLIRNLTHTGARYQQQIIGSGVLESITARLKDHIVCARLAEQALGALNNIAQCIDARDSIAQDETIKLIMDASLQHADSTQIFTNAASVLRNLTDSQPLQAAVHACDVHKWVMNSWQQPAIALDMFSLGCGAAVLRNLSRNRDWRSQYQDDGVVQALIDVLRAPSKAETSMPAEDLTLLSQDGLGALFHFAAVFLKSGGEQNVTKLAEIVKGEHLVKLTLETMKRQQSDKSVLVSACALLRCIIHVEHTDKELCQQVMEQMYVALDENPTEPLVVGHAAGVLWSCLALGEDMQHSARKQGGSVIIRMLAITTEHPEAQEWLLGALRQLMVDDNNTIVHENVCAMTEDGAVQLCSNALKAHSDNEAVVARGMGALQAIAASSNRDFILARGGLGILMEMLSKYTEHKDICELAMSTIGNLMDDGNAAGVTPVASQIVPLVTQSMTLHNTDARILSQSLTLLRNLAVDPAAHSVIRKSKDSIQLIVNALSFPEDGVVHEAAAGLIWTLASGTDESRAALHTEGAVPALLSTLTKTSTVDFQICAFAALANITAYYDAARQAAMTDTLLDLAAKAMDLDTKNGPLQTHVLLLLSNICSSGDDKIINGIVTNGILDKVQATLRYFSTDFQDSWVQIAGHQILWSACSSNKSGSSTVVRGGGIAFSLNKVNEYSSVEAAESPRVYMAIFGLLQILYEDGGQLAGADVGQATLEDIVNAVTTCVSKHPDSIPMICSAFTLACTVGRSHPTFITYFKSDATRPSLVSAAMKHEDSAELQMLSSTMYMLLAKEDLDFALKICTEMKGVNAIIDAAARFPEDADVQSMAFEALWQIALNTATRDAMTIGNIIPLTCKAMRKHKFDSRVQEFGCRLLWALMLEDATSQKAVHQEGATRIVVGAMKSHSKQESLQAAAALAISFIANCAFQEHFTAVVKEGAIPLISAAMKLAPGNLDLQSSTCSAVASLSACDENVKQVLVKEGCFALLIKATTKFSDCQPLVESSAAAMCNLATLSLPQIKTEFESEKGLTAVESILEKHADHATLQRNCAMLTSIFQ